MATNQILYRLNKKWKDTERQLVFFLTDVRFVSHALSVILVVGICLVFLKEVKLKTLQGKKNSTGEINSDRALTESDTKS